MNDELKKMFADLNRAFEEFKKANDQRLDEIAAKGSATADTIAKVEAVNADITKIRAAMEELKTAQRAQETIVARIEALGGRGAESEETRLERTHARTLFAQAFKHGRIGTMPENIGDAELATFRNYKRGFMQYVRKGGVDSLTPEIRAAMTIGTDPEGGYFVPPDTTGRIVQFIYETSPLREFATVSQTSRKEKTGRNDLYEVGGSWVAEQGAPGETDGGKIGAWKIPVHDQAAEPKTTQDELDDADFDVEGWLIRKIGMKFGRMEATGFVTGNGVTRPRGFTTYPAGAPTADAWAKIEQVNTGGAGAFAAAPNGGDVFFDAIGKLKVPYRARARWAMNRTTEAATRKLKDSDGAYLWQPGLQAGAPMLLAGHPVSLFEDLAVIAADSLSIALADFMEAYEIVDRKGLTLVRDNLTEKPFIKLYTTRRVGGDVVNFEAIKLIKFAA